MNDPPTSPFEPRDVAKQFSWSAGPRDGGSALDTRGQPPIHDPFLHPPAPPTRRRSPWLAIFAALVSVLFVATAGLAFWLWRRGPAIESPFAAAPAETGDEDLPLPPPPPPRASDPDPDPPRRLPAPSASAAAGAVPKKTRTAQVGKIDVIDLGVDSAKTLTELLSEERAAAQREGKTLLLMTTWFGSPLFRDVDAALPDPLLQAALADVRLVRVDARYFEVELEEMGIPTDSYPWFFLLGGDLVPRDGINGGEWDDDIPANIAPVLGPFVKGAYRQRRQMWTPPRSKGVQL